MNAERNGSVHELSRIVGSLQQSVESMTKMWAAQERQAVEGRRILHEDIGELRVDLVRLSESIKPLAALKPDVETLMAARYRQQGAVWLGRLLIAAIAAAGGAIGALLTKFGLK